MEEQVLSIEQMKELKELGINTNCGSMYWHNYNTYDDPQWELCSSADVEDIATFTLQDILEMLPKETKSYSENHLTLEIRNGINDWIIYYESKWNEIESTDFISNSPLLAAFEMLKWVKQNNYI